MISQLYYDIGERIRKKRLDLHMTQEQLSERIGTSSKHLSEVERGNDRLSYDKLLRLCEALDCTTDYILKGTSSTADGILFPESIVEFLHRSDSSEVDLFNEYIRMYGKIRNPS